MAHGSAWSASGSPAWSRRPGANAQLTFDDRPVGWREAEQAVDKIASRFGVSAVRPAALVEDPDRPS